MGIFFGVNAVTDRGYNPSVKTSGFDTSPSIRSEAPSFIVARAAKPLVFGAKHQTQNVVRQSRTNILPKIHRGGENRFANAQRMPCTGEPRFALRRATVMRTRILSVTPINPLGVTAPLTSKGSRDSRSVLLGGHRGAEICSQSPLFKAFPPKKSGISAGLFTI